MGKRYIVSVCVAAALFLLGAVCELQEIGRVYAEVTEAISTEKEISETLGTEEVATEIIGGEVGKEETTTEIISGEVETEEATTEMTDGEVGTEEGATEEMPTEENPQDSVDETPPEVELVCTDKDGVAQEEITCCITISEEDFDNCKKIIHVERTDFQSKTEISSIENMEFENGVEKEVVFSEEGRYRLYVQSTDGTGNETISETIEFLIDRTSPNIAMDTGKMEENGCYETKKDKRKMTLEMQDYTLVKDSCKVVVLYNMEKERIVSCDWEEISEGNKTTIMFDGTFEDGSYKVLVSAQDEAGNETVKEFNFIIDNTVAEIEMNCDVDYEKWTDKDVMFRTTVEDNISGIKEVVYKVKGKVVKKVSFEEKTYHYEQEVTATAEADKVSGYSVCVEVVNGAGIRQTMKRQVYIDKTGPEVTLSGVENGEHYTGNQSVMASVRDISYKDTKTEYYVTYTSNRKSRKYVLEPFLSNQYEDHCVRELTKEGLYEIYAIATDSVGNRTKSNTLSFVIDKTAPVVEVSGVDNDAMTADTVTLQFLCEESFYETNDVVIEIDKTLDGKTTSNRMEGLLKDESMSVLEKQFAEDGTYEVSISAKDKAGNEAEVRRLTFSVDQTKPEIQIKGTDNYQLWSEPAFLKFYVEESYYKDNRVVINGTCRDIDGNIETLNIPAMKNEGKISGMLQAFERDGIYELQIRAEDKAGNVNSRNIHFLIDQTSPEIHGVEKHDGGYYQSFRLADSMEEIFRDLTVVSYQMRLNGVEYNGTDEITREGMYNLQVEVQDELGNESRESVEFVIDRTPPQVRFSGVADGETVKMDGVVSLELADANDAITGIRMNGAEYGTGVRELPYTEAGMYRIEVDCEDKAGNKATETISFLYESLDEESAVSLSRDGRWVFACVFVIGVLVICVGLGIFIKQRRREE